MAQRQWEHPTAPHVSLLIIPSPPEPWCPSVTLGRRAESASQQGRMQEPWSPLDLGQELAGQLAAWQGRHCLLCCVCSHCRWAA